jgi:hypothetical protein
MLCVFLGHALVVLALLNITRAERPLAPRETPLITMLFFLDEDEPTETDSESAEAVSALATPAPAPLAAAPPAAAPPAAAAPAAEESAAITQGFIDWPVKGKESAARVLAAEAEAERIAKMFAGPQGTWASLTKRERSKFNKFRWKPGVDGLERDEKGNTIYRMGNGCVLVNFVFFGCPIGAKPPPRGDMFENMREYFDEQRLPQTDEGNGTEPESMRPPKWQKPLP